MINCKQENGNRALCVKRLMQATKNDISLLHDKLKATTANIRAYLFQQFVTNADDLIALLRGYKGHKQAIMELLGNEYIKQLSEFTLAKLYDLRVLVGQRLDNALLINAVTSLTAGEAKMEPFLLRLDSFHSDNQTPEKHELYRDMVYACNNVYRQRREMDERDYYLMFFGRLFGYSKEQKIARSLELDQNVIVAGPSAQGDLGAIAKRMQKV